METVSLPISITAGSPRLGLYRVIWGNMGLYRGIWGYIGLYRGIWGYIGYIGACGVIWGYLGLYSRILFGYIV